MLCCQVDLEAAEAEGLQLSGPHILGVYEDHLPLDMHAVLTLGCVATVTHGARAKPLGEVFQLHELQVGAVCRLVR